MTTTIRCLELNTNRRCVDESDRRRPTKGFTLVELLVVIAIIVVLISILLPVLNKARASANTLRCLSNLRQVGQIIAMYTAENQQRLPYSGLWVAPNATLLDGCQMNDSPLAGMRSEGDISSNNYQPVYRGFSLTPDDVGDIVAPEFLICPATDTSYLQTCGQPQSPLEGYSIGHFRDGVPRQILTLGGGDDDSAIYSKVGQYKIGPSVANEVFSNYTFNTENTRVQNDSPNLNGALSVTINGTPELFQNVFANYSNCSYPYTGSGTVTSSPGTNNLGNAQFSIAKVNRPSETWMAFDGTNPVGAAFSASLKVQRAVFRHPNMSCNFVYFDGHAETLRCSDVDGGPIAGTIGQILDIRMLPVQPN